MHSTMGAKAPFTQSYPFCCSGIQPASILASQAAARKNTFWPMRGTAVMCSGLMGAQVAFIQSPSRTSEGSSGRWSACSGPATQLPMEGLLQYSPASPAGARINPIQPQQSNRETTPGGAGISCTITQDSNRSHMDRSDPRPAPQLPATEAVAGTSPLQLSETQHDLAQSVKVINNQKLCHLTCILTSDNH